MKVALFSKALAGDRTVFPFVQRQLRSLYAGSAKVVVITAASKDTAGAVAVARTLIAAAGLEPVLLHEQSRPVDAIRSATAIYICGGNVFRLAHTLQTTGWLNEIRDRVNTGVPYAGTSAGAVIAGPSIATTNSMPMLLPPSLNALNLIDVHINAHYPTGPEQGLGESRQTRILEVIEERKIDVLALRDGSGLSIEGNTAVIIGDADARYFPACGDNPCDISPRGSLPATLTRTGQRSGTRLTAHNLPGPVT